MLFQMWTVEYKQILLLKNITYLWTLISGSVVFKILMILVGTNYQLTKQMAVLLPTRFKNTSREFKTHSKSSVINPVTKDCTLAVN